MADREQSQAYNEDELAEETGEEYDDYQEAIQLPRHGMRTATVIGLIAGIISVLVPVIITLVTSGMYREAGSYVNRNAPIPSQLATNILMLSCLGLFLNVVVAFIAGYLTGKRAVRRTLGFYAGALVGAITEIGLAIVVLIPGYPTQLVRDPSAPAPTGAQTLQGYLVLLVVIVAYALVGGLFGRVGAAAATNKHPYYEIGRER